MFKLTYATEYLDKPLLRCARDIVGTKTWGGGAKTPLSPCSAAYVRSAFDHPLEFRKVARTVSSANFLKKHGIFDAAS